MNLMYDKHDYIVVTGLSVSLLINSHTYPYSGNNLATMAQVLSDRDNSSAHVSI